MTPTLALVFGIVAVGGNLALMLGYLNDRKKRTSDIKEREGQDRAEIKQLNRELRDLEVRVATLEGTVHVSEISGAETKKDIEYIKAAIDEIKTLLGARRRKGDASS